MQSELGRIADADFAHVDVMDNHFVPNLTFGPQMVGRIQETSPVPLDVHLMISDPERWAPEYAELGAASVTFHIEAATEPVWLARRLREIGARAGVAVKPGTPIEPLFDILDEFDQVLIMTVEPGFGGQSFMPETMPKLAALKTLSIYTTTKIRELLTSMLMAPIHLQYRTIALKLGLTPLALVLKKVLYISVSVTDDLVCVGTINETETTRKRFC